MLQEDIAAGRIEIGTGRAHRAPEFRVLDSASLTRGSITDETPHVHVALDQFRATAISGNDITSSCLVGAYVSSDSLAKPQPCALCAFWLLGSTSAGFASKLLASWLPCACSWWGASCTTFGTLSGRSLCGLRLWAPCVVVLVAAVRPAARGFPTVRLPQTVLPFPPTHSPCLPSAFVRLVHGSDMKVHLRRGGYMPLHCTGRTTDCSGPACLKVWLVGDGCASAYVPCVHAALLGPRWLGRCPSTVDATLRC